MKHFVLFITILQLAACRQEPTALRSIEGKQLPVSAEITPVDSIDLFIKPYRERVNAVLDSVLAYAPNTLTTRDGQYNTSEGNLMADILLTQARPIFKMRTGNEVDFALLNAGGIRSIISQGPVTARTAFEVMPFENAIVVVAIKGKSVRDLVSFLVDSRRPNPISGMKIVLDQNGGLESVSIGGQPFDENKTYHLATIDYLLAGGDDMSFLKENSGITALDYLLRNAMIDYFKKTDTLRAAVDDRFIKRSAK